MGLRLSINAALASSSSGNGGTDSAVCIVYLDADHIIFADSGINIITPLDSVKLVGEYTNKYRLIDGLWKIVKSHLRADWISGNYDLFEKAQARAAAAE